MSVFGVRLYRRGLQALLVLNALDAVFTSWWVGAGWAGEGNPVMARVLDWGLTPFIAVKLIMGMMAVTFLSAHGHRPLARRGLLVALVVYVAVLGVHLHAGTAQYLDGTLLTLASDLPR